jgi:hypothetical protein
MAGRHNRRTLRQRRRLSDRNNWDASHSKFAGQSWRGNSGTSACCSAARLSVRGAAGRLPAERMGDGRENLAGRSSRAVGLQNRESTNGNAY